MARLDELRKQREELDKEIERLEKDITVSDPIYLLSIEEYEKYRDKIPLWRGWCWLRTPGDSEFRIADVNFDGSIYYFGDCVDNNVGCIRPVLNRNNIDKEDRECIASIDDSRISFCGIIWVKLDDTFWIAETPIATRKFDEETNDYSKSEIRQFLLDWYESRKNW